MIASQREAVDRSHTLSLDPPTDSRWNRREANENAWPAMIRVAEALIPRKTEGASGEIIA